MKNTKTLVTSALLAALTCIATMVIQIKIGATGYIHPGDGFVLLCGAILGPFVGALAAGIGSMFADVFSGYVIYAPATLIIKALTAFVFGLIYQKSIKLFNKKHGQYTSIVLSGIVGESIVVLGYFVYEIFLKVSAGGVFNQSALNAAISTSAITIPLNTLQGIFGIIISLLLLPILDKILKRTTN